jgi:hypothetical protein
LNKPLTSPVDLFSFCPRGFVCKPLIPSLTMTFRTTLAIKVLGFASLAFALVPSLPAQTVPGKAEVRAIKGVAVYSAAAGPSIPLKVGTILGPGTTIKTGGDSSVDLFLGNSAGVVRMAENTTLALDKLTLTDTGADTAVEIQMGLSEGTVLGNVNKLSAASRYEIKTPNGVAGIRGTRYRMSANSFIVLLDGTLVFVYVPPGGNPTPYTLAGPPAVFFSPVAGVQPADKDLIAETNGQFGPSFRDRDRDSNRDHDKDFKEPFISPQTGKKKKD